ncbi:Flageller protein FlgA [gamma proteobacterium HdN1]|nr:Flageller protein FlgA [gamma proteobacterium HdN1]
MISVITPTFAEDAPTPTQPLTLREQVNRALLAFVEQAQSKAKGVRIKGEWNPIDPRLQLPVCPQTPTVQALNGRSSGRLTVKVECQTKGWSFMMAATLRTYQNAVIAKIPISRGQIIDTQAVELRETEITPSASGFYTRISDTKGLLAKRSIAANQVLTHTMLKNPDVIQRGQAVIIEAGNTQFSIRTAGVALASGAIGEIVRVKNSTSGRTVEGTIISDNTINIPL